MVDFRLFMLVGGFDFICSEHTCIETNKANTLVLKYQRELISSLILSNATNVEWTNETNCPWVVVFERWLQQKRSSTVGYAES